MGKGKRKFSLRPDGWTDEEEWKFERLWEEFPPRLDRKNGKQYAREVFKHINPSDEMLENMIEAIRRQKKSLEWRKEHGAYVPDLSSWLNQQRWEDEICDLKTGNPI